MITWKKFYDKYNDWAESTLLSRISSLQDMGPTSEIVDCVKYIPENAGEKLLRKAMNMGTVFTPNDIWEMDGVISEHLAKEILERYMATGVPISITEIKNLDGLMPQEYIDRTVLYDLQLGLRFTPNQILDLEGCVSEKVLTEALVKSNSRLSAREIEALDGIVDEKVLRRIDKKQKTHAFDEETDWDDYADTSEKKPGLLSLLGSLYVASEIDKQAFGSKKTSQKYRIGDVIYVRRYGRRESGMIADITGKGRYSVDLDNGLYLQGVSETDIEKKGIFG